MTTYNVDCGWHPRIRAPPTHPNMACMPVWTMTRTTLSPIPNWPFHWWIGREKPSTRAAMSLKTTLWNLSKAFCGEPSTLANFHSGISNVDYLQGAVLLSETPESPPMAVAHPSRGAITPYHNATLKATQHIPAGMELFADYGDVWDGNFTADIYQDKITRFDYEQADEILEKILEFQEQVKDQMTPELQDEVLDFILEKILGTAAGKHAKTIKGLIPAHPAKLQRVKDAGGTFAYRYPDLIKTPAWLQKHGMCMDNLKAGPSTIPDAGRGAFATRDIKANSIIVPSPMLHIADKDLMNMYEIQTSIDENGDEFREHDETKPIGKQLFLNYCFGNPHSSLLLFPLGSLVTLINHKPEGATANAYITWSTDKSLQNQHEYHDASVEDLSRLNRIALVMKVVAIRDIKEGEEIFLDYGPEWTAAWKDYKIKWEMSKQGKPWPIKADDMKRKYKNQPLETRDTMLASNSARYPPNVATVCYIESVEIEDGKLMVSADHHEITQWVTPAKFHDYEGTQSYIVDVLERTRTKDHFFYNYTVLARVGEDRIEQVVNVPHAACTFVNMPYTGDTYTRGAFRHAIGIIDSHFPMAWGDLREDAEMAEMEEDQ
jgi:hypothetical protein